MYRLTEKRVAGPRDDRRTARLEGRRRSSGWPDEGESENEVARRERESELVGEREEEGRKALARAVCWSLEEAATRERRRGRRGGCVASSVASVRGRTRRQGEEGRRAVGGREGRASPQPMRGASGRARDSTPPSVVMATGETREKPAREFALVGGRSVSGVVLVGSRSLVGPKNSRIEAVVEYHLSSPPPACAGTSALVDLQAHAQLIDWVARARARSFSSFSLYLLLVLSSSSLSIARLYTPARSFSVPLYRGGTLAVPRYLVVALRRNRHRHHLLFRLILPPWFARFAIFVLPRCSIPRSFGLSASVLSACFLHLSGHPAPTLWRAWSTHPLRPVTRWLVPPRIHPASIYHDTADTTTRGYAADLPRARDRDLDLDPDPRSSSPRLDPAPLRSATRSPGTSRCSVVSKLRVFLSSSGIPLLPRTSPETVTSASVRRIATRFRRRSPGLWIATR